MRHCVRALLRFMNAFALSVSMAAPVLAATNSAQSPPIDDFKVALSYVLNDLLTAYRDDTGQSLNLYVLNNQLPGVRQFFAQSPVIARGIFSEQAFLGIIYEPNARIRDMQSAQGGTAPACLLQYSPQARDQVLGGYENTGLFNKRDILFYLATHEFAHCIVFDQARQGAGPALSVKDHELFADQFAMAHFMREGRKEAALAIVHFNERYVRGETHQHGQSLGRWYQTLEHEKRRGSLDPIVGPLGLYAFVLKNRHLN